MGVGGEPVLTSSGQLGVAKAASRCGRSHGHTGQEGWGPQSRHSPEESPQRLPTQHMPRLAQCSPPGPHNPGHWTQLWTKFREMRGSPSTPTSHRLTEALL